MKVLVDGDGCPDISDINELCKLYDIPCTVYTDYSHISNNDLDVILVPTGKDSVDMKIVHDCLNGDIVITQDYGLASLVIAKRCFVLHVSGMVISDENINSLLLQRFIGQKNRKANIRVTHKKRTKVSRERLLSNLENLISK